MLSPVRHPTLLTAPAHAQDPTAVPVGHQVVLPHEPKAYVVTQHGDVWMVNDKATGMFVYLGPGPVTLAPSPAPF